MKKSKKLLALLLCLAMVFGLAACGNSGDEGSANTPAGGETTPVTDGTGEPSAEGKNRQGGHGLHRRRERPGLYL